MDIAVLSIKGSDQNILSVQEYFDYWIILISYSGLGQTRKAALTRCSDLRF